MTRQLVTGLACVLLVISLVGCGEGDADGVELDAVAQLVDEHNAAWVDGEPDRIAEFYSEEGVFMDTLRREHEGRAEIEALAEQWGHLITEASRTGPVEHLDGDTYVFPMRLVHDGETVSGVIAVVLQDGEFVRYGWNEGGPHTEVGG